MDTATEQRFAEIDEHIVEVDRRLGTIARQNAALAEMVELLGSYVNAGLDQVHQHIQNDH